MPLPYCQAFTDWLKTDRKEQPPCGDGCAEAASARTRAAELHARATSMETAADNRIMTKHPPKVLP